LVGAVEDMVGVTVVVVTVVEDMVVDMVVVTEDMVEDMVVDMDMVVTEEEEVRDGGGDGTFSP
jgi:hypothetical protein